MFPLPEEASRCTIATQKVFSVGLTLMGTRILVVDDSPTIRRVVTSILRKQDYDVVAAEDGIDGMVKLNETSVDLVLVDFVMPRMNGYQFCQTLREQERFSQLPIVLMSAKGDKIRGKFVQQTGALDAITKPFDARGLVAVVESALRKSAEGASRASMVQAEDELASSPGSTPISDSTSQKQSRAALALSEIVAQRLEASLQSQGLVLHEGESLAQILSRVIDPEALHEIRTAFDAELPDPADVLAGSLAAVSIAEILQLLELQRKTGALTVSHRRRQITLFFSEGLLDFATYSGLRQEFLLGRYLVDSGAMERLTLNQCVEESRESGKVLGDYLVEQGHVEAEVVQRALTRQSTELVYEVVRWRKGRFRFRENPENELAARTRLGIPTGGLVMEGFRRVDEWRLIEDSFNFSDVLYRDDQVIEQQTAKNKLESLESDVLGSVNGFKTVAELIDETSASSFETGKVIYRLLKARLVKRSEG